MSLKNHKINECMGLQFTEPTRLDKLPFRLYCKSIRSKNNFTKNVLNNLKKNLIKIYGIRRSDKLFVFITFKKAFHVY